MTSTYPSTDVQGSIAEPVAATRNDDARRPRRLSTETKASYKTSEFFVYVAAVVGVILASWLVKSADGHSDYFRADRAWFYIVLLTIGYVTARGLAKAGSRDPYDAA